MPVANCAHHIIKPTLVGANVVSPVTGLNVFVVGATVKNNMAFKCHVVSIFVVGGLVRPHCQAMVVNSTSDVQFED